MAVIGAPFGPGTEFGDAGATARYTHSSSNHLFYDTVNDEWFGVMQNAASPITGTANEHYIYKWDGVTPSPGVDGGWAKEDLTNAFLDTRNSGRLTSWWDDANREFHVYEGHPSSASRYWRFDYDGTNWTIGIAREDVTGVAADLNSDGVSGGLAVDSNGVVWLAIITGGDLEIWERDTGSWTLRDTPLTGLGVSGNTRAEPGQWKDDDGVDAIFCACSDDTNQQLHMVFRKDSAALTAAWSTEVGTDPINNGDGSDNHISTVSVLRSGDSTSTICVSSKSGGTSYYVAIREADGIWTEFTLTGSNVSGGYTRMKSSIHGDTMHVTGRNSDADTSDMWDIDLSDLSQSGPTILIQPSEPSVNGEVVDSLVSSLAIPATADFILGAHSTKGTNRPWFAVIAGSGPPAGGFKAAFAQGSNALIQGVG